MRHSQVVASGSELGTVSLLNDLDAFYLEHRRCGDLAGDVHDPDGANPHVWMSCTCGACLNREIVASTEAAK